MTSDVNWEFLFNNGHICIECRTKHGCACAYWNKTNFWRVFCVFIHYTGWKMESSMVTWKWPITWYNKTSAMLSTGFIIRYIVRYIHGLLNLSAAFCTWIWLDVTINKTTYCPVYRRGSVVYREQAELASLMLVLIFFVLIEPHCVCPHFLI